MAMNLPSVKPKPSMPESFDFASDMDGNVMAGPMTGRARIAPQHPAQVALANGHSREEIFNNSALLMAQGPGTVMMRAMELRAAKSIGRLPFLQGSNFQYDVLTGKDEEIDFEDVFATYPRFNEAHVHPHTVMDNVNHKF